MKIKSKECFLDVIQSERAWRRKELTNLGSLIHKSREVHNTTLVRAGILLLYSHWEGYIKKVCEAFFHYMNFKAHKYSDLKPNFIAMGIANDFNGNFPQKKFDSYMKSVSFIISDSDKRTFNVDVDSRVDTKSNLSTEVLVDLLNMVGIDTEHFTNNQQYIDSKLLKYRNAIAHGERTDNNPDLSIGEAEYLELYLRVNALLDHFESIICNHIELETYKAN